MTADRKFIACDPADLEAVLRWVSKIPLDHDDEVVPNVIDRLRADLARAFTVEDVRQDAATVIDFLYKTCTGPQGHIIQAAERLARRLSPPVEHKVTLHGLPRDPHLMCSCRGFSVHALDTDDPLRPARLAQAHLAEHGEDR